MMTVATAPARTDADAVKAGEWPRFGWDMVWTYAVEPKKLREVDELNAIEIGEQMPDDRLP